MITADHLYYKYKYPKETIEFKIRDVVFYKGEQCSISRIDGHVYPICLSNGLRVLPKDISKDCK